MTQILFRFDARLTFNNLKNGSAHGNTIGQSERQRIWIPNLVFGNSVVDSYIQVDDLASLFVKMDESGLKKTSKELQENEEYMGIQSNSVTNNVNSFFVRYSHVLIITM